ncbi:AzlD domain-containing protein [Cellulomonas endophytica]|uniref:AzlD domain-containing protein n=1 Tax=Cellulomonas endophytica TaxID=2494735 RepID=UPI00101391B2|nr:AzlD domain-containing protein [Cellulomonas endophytica]
MSTAGLVATLAALAVGTFALRVVGGLLRDRVDPSPRALRLLEVAAVTVLTALVATSALLEGGGPAGVARPAGVAVGGLLAVRRAPFVVVVLAAAATTALLRLLGVP